MLENSSEIGLPEAAQNARRELSLPHGWLEIGERAERVKELGAGRASDLPKGRHSGAEQNLAFVALSRTPASAQEIAPRRS